MAGPAGGSPLTKRPRSSWFLRVTTILDISQFEIGYKNTRGEVSSFSKSKSSPKVPFGPPLKVKYAKKKVIDDDDIGEYKFTNKRRETAPFSESAMNNFNVEGGINSFSKRVTTFNVEGRQTLLSLYLSLISNTAGFVHHREEHHDSNGFLLDGSGIQEEDLKQNGGNLAEFQDFVRVALASAVTVEKEALASNPISNYFQVNLKRSQNNNSQPKKKSKTEMKNENEQREIDDEKGLELEYKNSYLGLAEIPLDNIMVAPDLKSNINPLRVHSVVDSMLKRYDPAISILVVCPINLNKVVDLSDVDNEKFYCIQKIHTLEAFHKLDKDGGKFEGLTSHGERKVICYVIKTVSSELVHYGHLRPTSIENNFMKKIYPQHILHVFQSLAVDGNVNACKVVERISRLCRFGANEAASISKLCRWSKEAFSALIRVLQLYEKYETLDVGPSGHQGRLARGEKMPMTNKLFNQLGKTDESYFIKGFEKVLAKDISLKYLVEQYGIIISLEKVVAVLSVLAEHKSYDSIKLAHPGKFEHEQIEVFSGAEIKADKKMNENALRLEKYYKAVVNMEPNALQILLEFNEFNELKDLNIFSQYNTIVMLMSKDSSETCLQIADYVLKSEDIYVAAILVFPSEALQFQFLSFIRNKDVSLLKNFKVSPLVINCDVKGQKEFEENVSFGVIFGKLNSFKRPVKIHHNSLSNLKDIVESVSPPNGTTVVIADHHPLVKVHTVELLGKFAYYASKSEISRFKISLSKDGNFHASQRSGEKDKEPSTLIEKEVSETEGREVFETEVSETEVKEVFETEVKEVSEMEVSAESGLIKADDPLKVFDYQEEMKSIEMDIDSDDNSYDGTLYE